MQTASRFPGSQSDQDADTKEFPELNERKAEAIAKVGKDECSCAVLL